MTTETFSLKLCEACGKPLPESKRINARFCSPVCSAYKYQPKNKTTAPQSALGTISELIVCADLLAKGYYVFRNISPHGPCDLVILKNGKCFRVEVKTGYIRVNGKMGHSPVGNNNSYDILAIAVDGKPVYLNELP